MKVQETRSSYYTYLSSSSERVRLAHPHGLLRNLSSFTDHRLGLGMAPSVQADGDWVNLGLDFPKDVLWSNDPADLHLNIYFDTAKTSNLSHDYDIQGLKPIIAEKEGDTFLLTDSQWRYYSWNRMNGELWMLRGIAAGEQNLQAAVSTVMEDLDLMKKERVWSTEYLNRRRAGA